jgi:hypothetical protein
MTQGVTSATSSIGQETYDRNEDPLREKGYYIIVPRPDPNFTATIEEMQELVKKPLEERVRIVGEKNFGKDVTVSVDSAIRYERHSDIFCKLQEELWQKHHARIAQVETASPKGKIFTLIFPNRQPLGKAEEAKYQAELWKQLPLDRIAKQRTEVYLSSKPYAHLLCQNDILHPLEKQALHERYTQDFCKKLLAMEVNDEAGRKQWKAQFYEYNPFQYDSYLAQPLKAAARDLDKLSAISRHSPHCPGVPLQQYLQNNFKRSIEWESKEKEKALQWEMSKHRITLNEAKQEMKADFEKKKEALDEVCKTNIETIERTFQKNIQTLQKECQEHLKLIDEEFNERYYNAARQILVRAEKAMNGEAYQPIDFNEYFPWIKNL